MWLNIQQLGKTAGDNVIVSIYQGGILVHLFEQPDHFREKLTLRFSPH